MLQTLKIPSHADTWSLYSNCLFCYTLCCHILMNTSIYRHNNKLPAEVKILCQKMFPL